MCAEALLAAAQQKVARKQYEEALSDAECALTRRPNWVDALGLALYAAAKLGRVGAFETHARAARTLRAKKRRQLSDEKIGNLALRAGSHGVAAEIGSALTAKRPGSRTGIFLLASVAWEVGDEPAAERIVADALAHGSEGAARAAIDYRLRLDDVEGAGRLLETCGQVDDAVRVDIAEAFQAQGDVVRATETVVDARQHGVFDARLDAVEEAAKPLGRLLDGSWCPRIDQPTGTASASGRVLHLVTRSLPYYTAGGTVRNQYVAKAQLAAGIDAVVATSLGFPWSRGHSDAPHTTHVDGVTYRHIGATTPVELPIDEQLARTVDALLPLVRQLRPAVLHPASDYRNALVALAIGRRLGIPVVYEVRGFPEERLRRRPGSRAWMDRSVARRELERRCALAADHIVTLASVMKERLIERGVDPGRITVIPNGVDSASFAPRPRDERLAAQLRIEPGETVLGYVSSFKAFEGIEGIIEVTAELRARGYAVRALLVGGGDQEGYLRRRARELGVAAHVIFTGRVNHAAVPDYYSLIDLFICPRRAEATSELVTPLKPFEAMAMERPVIVSRTRALQEIIQDGVTGRTFSPDDLGDLAAVCAGLIDRPDEQRRLATAARAWVVRERSWASHGRRYRRLYQELESLRSRVSSSTLAIAILTVVDAFGVCS